MADESVDHSERVAAMLHEFKLHFESEAGKNERSGAVEKLPAEGQVRYKAGDYEAALALFAKALAADLLDDTRTHNIEASLYANLGACLHHMDEASLAEKYYTRAVEIFESSCATGRFEWLIYGDINQRRIDYVKGRLSSLSLGNKPAKETYLDGNGKERQWAVSELGPDGVEWGYTDYVNPLAWYRYYSPAAPAAPAEPTAAETI